MMFIRDLNATASVSDTIKEIISHSNKKQSIVYFNSRDTAIEYAVNYADSLHPKNDPVLDALAKEIQNEIHDSYYLAELIKKGVAYHVGYLPNHIRTSIEKCFREQKIDILFCTSTLIEGVNLPADNLFVMSYRNGPQNMSPVEFRNLIGRVGRIEYNLYGTVFILRHQPRQREDYIHELLSGEVPAQEISLVTDLNSTQKKYVVSCLLTSNVQFEKLDGQNDKSYQLMRKFGLILLRDIMRNRNSTVKCAFAEFLTPEKEDTIRQLFHKNKTKPDDDINISVDQTESLASYIAKGATYPIVTDNKFDHATVVGFLEELCTIFKWNIYEKDSLGFINKDGEFSLLSWYAVILSQWMEGNGLNSIIREAIKHKETTYNSAVKINNLFYQYNGSRAHKNAVIAETLSIIDHVILFSVANYFLRFSTEYKLQHGITDNFNNDWYEFVEYGSTNPLTIMLQRNGFSRETSEYIKQNKVKYVIDTPNGPRLRTVLLECPKESVKREVLDIQYNVPELFISSDDI